jgi:hypothetical protein
MNAQHEAAPAARGDGGNTELTTAIVFTQRMEELARFYAEGLGIGPYQSSPRHLGCQVGAVYFGFDPASHCGSRWTIFRLPSSAWWPWGPR